MCILLQMSECIWFNYIDPAVDAEELAGLVVEFFQIFSVPVEIRSEEQVRPQVYTVPVRTGHGKLIFKIVNKNTIVNVPKIILE